MKRTYPPMTCASCHKRPAREKSTTCVECHRAYNREWARQHRAKRRKAEKRARDQQSAQRFRERHGFAA